CHSIFSATGIWGPGRCVESGTLAAGRRCHLLRFDLSAIAGFSKLTFRAIDVSAEGTIEKQEGGLRFTPITLKPVVTIEREEDRERARKILEKAERGCLVSRSLACQVMLERRSNLRKLWPPNNTGYRGRSGDSASS